MNTTDPASGSPSLCGSLGEPLTPETLAAFASAVHDDARVHHDPVAAADLGYPDVIAPLTFPWSLATVALQEFLTESGTPVDISRVLHTDQRIVQHRPVVAGDRLATTVAVESVRRLAGSTSTVIRVEVRDAAGGPVQTMYVSLVGKDPVDAVTTEEATS